MNIPGKKTILLVEDEALVAMAEALSIQGFGYEVITVASGEEAVEHATRNSEIKLVLMDIVLGGRIDGTEAARRILEKRTVPIVFLSSHSEREIVETVKGITRYGYVIKSSGDFVLRSSIETAFDLFEKQEALQESENRLRDIMFSMVDWVWEVDEKGVYTYSSERSIDIFGHSPGNIIGKTPFDLMPPDEAMRVAGIFSAIAARKAPIKDLENWNVGKNGEKIFLLTNGVPILDKEGNLKGYRGVDKDITERKRVEEEIKSLLAEKELLLKEVHHRIKNNMMAMMGLLKLQANAMKEPSAAAALQEAQTRLRSMVLLYDKLYRSENLREMSARDYLPSLIDEIVGLFPNCAGVKVEKKIEDFPLGVKELSPLGIILNELLTNIMKHAFVGKDNGLITVSASKRNNTVTISIGDDGVGIPESVDVEDRSGFGLMLVGTLAKQLNGSIRIEREKGTRFILSFGARSHQTGISPFSRKL